MKFCKVLHGKVSLGLQIASLSPLYLLLLLAPLVASRSGGGCGNVCGEIVFVVCCV